MQTVPFQWHWQWQWPLGLFHLKWGHGVFGVRNYFSECSACEGETVMYSDTKTTVRNSSPKKQLTVLIVTEQIQQKLLSADTFFLNLFFNPFFSSFSQGHNNLDNSIKTIENKSLIAKETLMTECSPMAVDAIPKIGFYHYQHTTLKLLNLKYTSRSRQALMNLHKSHKCWFRKKMKNSPVTWTQTHSRCFHCSVSPEQPANCWAMAPVPWLLLLVKSGRTSW